MQRNFKVMNKMDGVKNMSSIETLPQDFCVDPDNAWTFPKVFYTS